MSPERHTKAEIPTIVTDPVRLAELEALNGLRQFEAAIDVIEDGIAKGKDFRVRPSMILHLHRVALDQISDYAGVFRPGVVEIQGSEHKPHGAYLVPELIEALCDYVNENWKLAPIFLSAYVMWRLNWIHPFIDGNGRTARVLSYIVLCIRLGYRLPGKNTIPDQIAANREPYYQALEHADRALQEGAIDLSEMEKLLESLLAGQLLSVIDEARS